ncbi:MAG: cache domain-containing protein [Anaerolineaceae bacterium]|nr:cache domain-containing protein [Anaerolineaceae bacterium]MDE0327842.1 cache domain-containing protein [Anaerolineaceae bacterium]
MQFRLRGHRLAAALFTLALLALSLLTAPAAAQTPCDSHEGRLADLHTRDQLKALVRCAAEHVAAVGWEQAAQDFETDAWWERPVYIFATRADGTVLLSPGSEINPGDNLWDWQDPDGVYPSREQVRVARDFGGGYVYLRSINPDTGREDPLETYVAWIDYQGEPAYLGAAIYPLDTHGTCSPEVVRASMVYNERDVERFVTCAEHHLQQRGLQALHDFNSDPRWIAGPTYLILLDMESLVALLIAGQPHMTGVDGNAMSDVDGVRFGREKQRILASHDDGYVYYRFENPASGAEEPKSTYVRRVLVDGHAYILGAGLYVPAAECRALPPAQDIDTRDELQQYVRCAKDLIDERGELAWDLFLNHPQWIGGSAYLFVLDDQCRQLVYPLDYERQENDEPRCHVTDANGFPVNQEIRATTRSEVGEGWVDYVWLNPANDVVEVKHSYVIGGALHGDRVTGEHISIGAGLYESQMQPDGQG